MFQCTANSNTLKSNTWVNSSCVNSKSLRLKALFVFQTPEYGNGLDLLCFGLNQDGSISESGADPGFAGGDSTRT